MGMKQLQDTILNYASRIDNLEELLDTTIKAKNALEEKVERILKTMEALSHGKSG